jgi:hypothetical protein
MGDQSAYYLFDSDSFHSLLLPLFVEAASAVGLRVNRTKNAGSRWFYLDTFRPRQIKTKYAQRCIRGRLLEKACVPNSGKVHHGIL